MKLALVGGFLGSGKTTAITGACRQLLLQNKKVAVITNDQGEQQVDSALIKSLGIPGREVINGCFCCNFEQLDIHLQSLEKEAHPDILFAESVGSCTDLIATIAKPLKVVRPELEIVISIFADADLLASWVEGRSHFLEESVRYIYKKQLEEADLLVINKTDLLEKSQLQAVDAMIRTEYPGKKILHQNSMTETDISCWLNEIVHFAQPAKRDSLQIDYDVYGDGESKMAWLDKSMEIHTAHGNASFVTSKIISSIFDEIQIRHLTIGHLKFFVDSGNWKEKISFTATSTRADIMREDDETNLVNLLVNARIQTDPDTLEKIISEVLGKAERSYDCKILENNTSAFKPGYPRPTHRITS